MRIDNLFISEDRAEHIAQEHLVTEPEVQEICVGPHMAEATGDDKYIIKGVTTGGRFLKVIVARNEGNDFRLVTAYEMSETDKRRYRRRLRKK